MCTKCHCVLCELLLVLLLLLLTCVWIGYLLREPIVWLSVSVIRCSIYSIDRESCAVQRCVVNTGHCFVFVVVVVTTVTPHEISCANCIRDMDIALIKLIKYAKNERDGEEEKEGGRKIIFVPLGVPLTG